MKRVGVCICLWVSAMSAYAQQDSLLMAAHKWVVDANYGKALEIYKPLYTKNTKDADVYKEYLNTLISAKKYKEAENIVNEQMANQPPSPFLHIDLARVYEAARKDTVKDKKPEEQYAAAVQFINGDDILTQRVANAFTAIHKDLYAIQVYEKAGVLINQPFLYCAPLSKLYAHTNQWDKAVTILLDGAPWQPNGMDNVKATLLELLNGNEANIQLCTKALIKRINRQPDNIQCIDLLTWFYTQRNDWDGALIQMQALDERTKDNGTALFGFARMAARERQYETATKTYNAIIDKGKDKPLYVTAKSERMNVHLQQLKANPVFTPDDVKKVVVEYDTFFIEFPQYYANSAVMDYAMLQAQYAGEPKQGIATLQKAIEQPNVPTQFVGQCKLQMGDYYILTGKLWDASLIYGQVDKAFRNDAMGEEARFRIAKVYYYTGGFEYAQSQLTVLKSSTSELIANDALYLSVLITENIDKDSNVVPLQRFAYADLLLFQNKDKEAEELIDSISKSFPKHPLLDDILMLHARICEKRHDYTQALTYLKDIYTKYSTDVLGDDAVFKTALIYENGLPDKDKAKEFYEKLIVDYPGSTYVQVARQRLRELTTAHSGTLP